MKVWSILVSILSALVGYVLTYIVSATECKGIGYMPCIIDIQCAAHN